MFFYFRAHGYFLDGGLIANNPSLDCLTEIHEYNMALKAAGRESELAPITALVSIGTGNIPITEVDINSTAITLILQIIKHQPS